MVTPWWEAALCAQTDPEVQFPERGISAKSAKRTCAACEVRADCLTYALNLPVVPYGIWGGKSERERRGMRVSAA